MSVQRSPLRRRGPVLVWSTVLWPGTLIAIAALIAAACGGVSNEDVEADEFFRPPSRAAAAGEDASADRDQPADDGEDAQPDAQPSADAEGETDSDDQVRPDSLAPATGEEEDGDLELAEDIVRRYRNPTYGYSLELVCGPFCDVNPGGIDRVGFGSETDPTVINVRALTAPEDATLADLATMWRNSALTDVTPNILASQEVTLASDGTTPAIIVDWEIDRRATGGSLERWRSLITRVGPITYFLNAGALADFFEDLEPVLQQSIDSFLAIPNPDSLPGLYTRFDFTVAYDTDGFVGEIPLLGVANQPTANGGRFFFQDAEGQLQFILTWESLSQAIYNADSAIDDESQPPGAVAVVEDDRGDFQLSDAIAGRFGAFTATDAAGNTIAVRIFSWYCEEGGRSFTLQSLSDAARPAVLDGFRCLVSEDTD